MKMQMSKLANMQCNFQLIILLHYMWNLISDVTKSHFYCSVGTGRGQIETINYIRNMLQHINWTWLTKLDASYQ